MRSVRSPSSRWMRTSSAMGSSRWPDDWRPPPGRVHEITDAIAAMGLDVLKMHSDTVTTIDHNKKKKVEHEIFYAKRATDASKKKMITPKRRAEIRQGLDEDHARAQPPRRVHGEGDPRVRSPGCQAPTFDANERVCVVKCVGSTTRKCCTRSAISPKSSSSTLHAEVDVKDSGDEHIFYVERTDERYPDGLGESRRRTMRHDLRRAIRKIYGTHSLQGRGVGPSPPNPGAGAPINDRLSFERLPPAVVDTNGKKRIRIANGGVRWFDELPHWLDSTFESNDEISAPTDRGVGALTASGGFTPTPMAGVDGFGLPPMSPLGGAVPSLDAAALAAGRKSGLPSPSAASPSTASASNETSRDRKRSVTFGAARRRARRESDGDILLGVRRRACRAHRSPRDPMRNLRDRRSELAMSAPQGLQVFGALRSPKTSPTTSPHRTPSQHLPARSSRRARSPRDQRR